MHRIRLIGVLFVVFGTIGWLQTMFALGYSGTLRLGIDLLLLPIGFGLLRLRERGRRNALRMLAVLAGVVVTVTVIAVRIDALVAAGPFPSWLPSLSSEQQVTVLVAWASVQLAVIGWMAWQLHRADHRKLFCG